MCTGALGGLKKVMNAVELEFIRQLRSAKYTVV